ncbi:hypothetical protein H5410_016722 [Solanum commersonii]|uniref:Uncharacterized protein n=1 Tax=Solanum commersonii TaxID=4109 RepID=A0A9J5ZY42_SOLCO|nr:hypothetical protein H5410_016722 [Solanum commersonii]
MEPFRGSIDIEQYKRTLGFDHAKVIHTYREANYLADYLANIAIDSNNKQKFWGFGELPSSARGLINIDKQQIQSFRVRRSKGPTKENRAKASRP